VNGDLPVDQVTGALIDAIDRNAQGAAGSS